MTEPLLTASEAAAALGLSRSTFYRLLRLKQLVDLEAKQPVGMRRFVAAAIERRNARTKALVAS